MAQSQTAERGTAGRSSGFGTLGWFSLLGFLIMGLLYVLDVAEIADSILPPMATLLVAVVAGIGALLFYVGNDPTAGRR
ncbi:hypothetical protein [Halorarum salinum]|uniref:Uncharacterized protein n=1 Tax=Halorarum salinum TaxID=2743089 RepID=A0A7D5QNS9_9EURY|nr:hypothetical protein [Halobaculum salinum]QLG64325.1 hypothetical protein HUG12_21340 [Halobaculum salinum]